MKTTRRELLRNALFGSGYVGLQSLATGLPISALVNGIPRNASAMEPIDPQYLILISHSQGDPVNINAPGSYPGNDPSLVDMYNNPHTGGLQGDGPMAPVSVRLGDRQYTAARPWTTLPEWAYDRTTFIHHRTYQNAHPQYGKVMGLVGSAKRETGSGTEHVGSVYSTELAAGLETIQMEPVSLFNQGVVTFEGRTLQSIRPGTLSSMFQLENGEIGLDLQAQRETKLKELNDMLKTDGTPAQRRWLDRHASSREQVRSIDEGLLSTFNNLSADGEEAMIDAAIALIRMNVTPVIRIHIGFGADNHADPGYEQERDETITGTAKLNYLLTQLRSAGLEDRVTVANLHVFGRTFKRKLPAEGRDHNLNHHVMMITGSKIRPGVIGKIVPSGDDFGATGIDSATGAGDDSADIPASETLEAASKTLGSSLGISKERLDTRITGGKTITAALRE